MGFAILFKSSQRSVFSVWLSVLLALSITELQTLAFKTGKVNIFNTYTFVVLQLPLHLCVLFGCHGLCSIGYHLMVLGK